MHHVLYHFYVLPLVAHRKKHSEDVFFKPSLLWIDLDALCIVWYVRMYMYDGYVRMCICHVYLFHTRIYYSPCTYTYCVHMPIHLL
ncbi:hypothetical protein EON63_20825 [archaeon]|nr:MAG: hypothetical protein EON63_20825 [archaeon]